MAAEDRIVGPLPVASHIHKTGLAQPFQLILDTGRNVFRVIPFHAGRVILAHRADVLAPQADVDFVQLLRGALDDIAVEEYAAGIEREIDPPVQIPLVRSFERW